MWPTAYSYNNIVISFRLRTSIRSPTYSCCDRRSIFECQGNCILLCLHHISSQPILRAEGHVPNVAYPKMLRAHSWPTLLFAPPQGPEATRYFWKTHLIKRRRERRDKRRPRKGRQSHAVRHVRSPLSVKVLKIPRGDAYAVAQRFWEFSGIFAAPVRLAIALVFLYR